MASFYFATKNMESVPLIPKRGFCSRKALMFKKYRKYSHYFMRAGVKKVIERVRGNVNRQV
jgi:hypothetical protein